MDSGFRKSVINRCRLFTCLHTHGHVWEIVGVTVATTVLKLVAFFVVLVVIISVLVRTVTLFLRHLAGVFVSWLAIIHAVLHCWKVIAVTSAAAVLEFVALLVVRVVVVAVFVVMAMAHFLRHLAVVFVHWFAVIHALMHSREIVRVSIAAAVLELVALLVIIVVVVAIFVRTVTFLHGLIALVF